MKTKLYEYGIPSSKLIKVIDDVLLPYMPETTSVEVDGSSYSVKNGT